MVGGDKMTSRKITDNDRKFEEEMLEMIAHVQADGSCSPTTKSNLIRQINVNRKIYSYLIGLTDEIIRMQETYKGNV